MTTSSAPATADELFQKWKQFLDEGTLTTATFVAADHPDLADPLQQLINDFLADQAFEVEETLTAPAGAEEPEPPPSLPGLTVLDRLGGGGMGVVYRVRDPLDREFALKVARREHLSEAGRERFLDEARAMARLDHPHVARVHHFDSTPDGRPYFLMAIYPGSLAGRLAEYQADPLKAARLMAAVADGVGHLHAHGFVHRDLKPANILLTHDGRPAVSDFGLVKSLSDAGSASPARPGAGSGSSETRPIGPRRSKTMAGAAMGTRRYMAPEQAAGLTHLAGPQWDVWTLGVVLHELLTGQLPRSSQHPERMLDPDEPDNPPPSAVKPGLDRKLEQIIQKCLARGPKRRYPDGSAVARDLRDWLRARDPGRRARRRVLAAVGLGLLLAAGVTLAAPLLRPKLDRDTWASQAQQAVARGERVQLIPRLGEPRFPQWVIGGDRATTARWNPDQAYSIETHQTAYQELLPPDRVPESYTLRGTVRMNDGPRRDSSAVGIAFGCRRLPPGKHEQHVMMSALVSNLVVTPPGNSSKDPLGGGWLQAELTAVLGPPTSTVRIGWFQANPPRHFKSPIRGLGEIYPSHDIVVHVRGREVQAIVDGRPAGRASFDEMIRALRKPIPADIRANIATGGIGIVVVNGGGSFLELSIEPAADP